MSSKTIQSDFTETYTISVSSTKFTFEDGISGKTSSGSAILEQEGQSNNTIIMNGYLQASSTPDYGLEIHGTNTFVTIGKTGYVAGVNGAELLGVNTVFENNGLIASSSTGIFAASGRIVNNGTISGDFGVAMLGGDIENNGNIYSATAAINLGGDGIDCHLSKDSIITSDKYGIKIDSLSSQTNHVFNDGLIAVSNGVAIYGFSGREIIVNTGEIRGLIQLNGGNDSFDTRNGGFEYTVDGGVGNDTFLISSPKTSILEAHDSGNDTVKSTVSLSFSSSLYIPQELENLILLGSNSINATGNELANKITGNSGNNSLAGHGGADTFIFQNGNGQDTITDFNVAADSVDLSKYKGIDNFQDLKNHHAKTEGGDLVIFSGANEIHFDHVAKSHLSEMNFEF